MAPPAHQPQTISWFWWLPLVTIVLLVCIVGGFIWLGLKTERDERHTTLVGDSLWMEQNLRFHLENTESTLSQVGTLLARTRQTSPIRWKKKYARCCKAAQGWSPSSGWMQKATLSPRSPQAVPR